MDGLSDAEAMIVTGLMRECKEHERRDTFFPAFAGCSVCGGRIYACLLYTSPSPRDS